MALTQIAPHAPSPETALAEPSRIDRLRTRRRRGHQIVAGVAVLSLLVAGAFTYHVARRPGVYWSDVRVLFLAPSSAANPNALVTRSGSLITMAGVVAKLVDPKISTAHVVSTSIKLVNEGIRNGYAVTLPNDGGQWSNNFDRALIDVQAVGPSAAETFTTAQKLVLQIDATLKQVQANAGVLPVNMIHTSLNPAQIQTFYSAGSRARAVGTTLLLGIILSCVVTVLARRRVLAWVSRDPAVDIAGE